MILSNQLQLQNCLKNKVNIIFNFYPEIINRITIKIMLCCSDCNIQTESTLTTVIFINPHNHPVQNKLQQYAQKHQKRMHLKKLQQEAELINKQNMVQPNQNKKNLTNLDIPTQRKMTAQKQHIDNQNDAIEQTQRFRKKLETPKNSRVSRNMQSKTTSFTSLGSRPSTSNFYREREIVLLKDEFQKLKHEQNVLLKCKLEKQFMYKDQLSKINKKREQLKMNSESRQRDLMQLKKILLKHKKN